MATWSVARSIDRCLINGDVDSYGHGRMFPVQTVPSRDLFLTGRSDGNEIPVNL